MENFYRDSRAYAERMGGKFSPTWRAIFLTYARKVKSYQTHAERVLDLGCGNGLSTDYLAEELQPHRIAGMDLSWQSLQMGKQAGVLAPLLCGSVNRLPFRDQTFDVVTSHAMVEHLDDADTALAEMDRVLKAGGLLVINAPNMLSPFRSANLLWKGIRKRALHPDGTPGALLRCCVELVRRIGQRTPQFAYRKAVLETGRFLGSDYDATFLVNPLDLRAWARQRNYRVLNLADSTSRIGNLVRTVCPMAAGGILFVARKPVTTGTEQ